MPECDDYDADDYEGMFDLENEMGDSELGVYDFHGSYASSKGGNTKTFVPKARRIYGLGHANISYHPNYDPDCEKIVGGNSFKYIVSIKDKNKKADLLESSGTDAPQIRRTFDKLSTKNLKNIYGNEEDESHKIKNYKSRIEKLKLELKDEEDRSCQLSIMLNNKCIELETLKKSPNLTHIELDTRLKKEIIEKEKLNIKIGELNVALDKLTDENCKLVNKEKLLVESQNNASIKKPTDYITAKHSNNYKIKTVEVPKIIKTCVEVIKEVEIVKEVEVIKKVYRRNLTIVLSVVSLILGSSISGLVYHSIYLNKENSLIDEYEKKIDGYKKMLKAKNKSKKVNK